MADTYMNYIGGEWVQARKGGTFESRNPAHPEEVLGVFQHSTDADVDAAMEAAEAARTDWANTPAPERGLILNRVADLLQERRHPRPGGGSELCHGVKRLEPGAGVR